MKIVVKSGEILSDFTPEGKKYFYNCYYGGEQELTIRPEETIENRLRRYAEYLSNGTGVYSFHYEKNEDQYEYYSGSNRNLEVIKIIRTVD